ncbi:CheY chemotaxis protein or a CheY-like REC (receiver) domain [Hymenobacter gelipurpurascens]|uniref:CheY chemotaxis protein or a CheY-like REC (Receiver) domain n=1 Tax=Hymenobacter gelipurpurascens TaxID=89968 RepID=A0A212UEP5_9BACT|nr:response regulator [Hymenobacter gelipurpurascens]SNC76601.1 CheY chemotaxis protein or a CheY-like REC (receiver) domain [Hymenobacter gelipurpurascens]
MTALSLKPILVVEDSVEDFTALGRAFRKHALPNPLLRCEDGDQALEYLQGYGKRTGWPQQLPAFVLLDLNMPGTDGRTVLAVLKQDPLLQSIPVIIFSTSTNARDIEECYRLGANSYFTKPIDYAVLEEKTRLLMNYWLTASELPHLS